MSCNNCIHYNIDYEWSEEDEDEIRIDLCDKDREEFENGGEHCTCFTEPQPYKEQSTKCDKCYNLHKCVNDGILIETTLHQDNYRHYIFGLDGCPKIGATNG